MLIYWQKLPYDAEVEYLESTGTQRIETDLLISKNLRSTVRFKLSDIQRDNYVFGGMQGYSRFYGFAGAEINSCYYAGTYGAATRYDVNGEIVHTDLSSWHTAVIDSTEGSSTVKVDELDAINYPQTPTINPTTIDVFSAHNIEYNGRCRISYLQIINTSTDEIVLDLIPVRVGNVGYMYDKVSGKLFSNTGTGDFAVGDDVQNGSKLTRIASARGALMPLLPRYSFGVVSDLHVNREDNDAPADIERMFRAFENRKIKDVFCCGDITSSHTTAQLSAFSAIKDRHPGVRFCSCNGNHDVGLTDSDWQAYVGHPLRHSFAMGCDAFIFMPIAIWEGSHPYNDNLSWLEDQLAEYASSRVFLFIHFPLNSNSSDFQYPGLKIGQAYGFNADSEDNAAIIQLLKNHGNAVVFSGHSHYAFQTQDGQVPGESMVFFEEEGVSHVHVPSLSLPRDRNMQYMYDGHPELQPSQGYVVDVYDKFVRVKGVEFNLTEGDGRKGNDRLQNLYVSTNIVGYLG